MRGKRYRPMPKNLIASELRDYADELHPSVEYYVYLRLHDIADRIDDEHERRMRQVRGSYRGHIKKRAREYATKREREVEVENAALRDLVADFDKCLDTALWLASEAGYPVMPDQKLFDSLRPRMLELGVEVDG